MKQQRKNFLPSCCKLLVGIHVQYLHGIAKQMYKAQWEKEKFWIKEHLTQAMYCSKKVKTADGGCYRTLARITSIIFVLYSTKPWSQRLNSTKNNDFTSWSILNYSVLYCFKVSHYTLIPNITSCFTSAHYLHTHYTM